MKYLAYPWPDYQDYMGEDWFREECFYDSSKDTYLIPENRVDDSEFLFGTNNTPKYDIGDEVIIKSIDWYNNTKDRWDNICLDGGNITFIPEMSKYCGKTATIVDIDDYGYYRLDIDKGEYDWYDEMFEKIIGLKHKVGDKVTIKSLEWYDMNHDGLGEVPLKGDIYFAQEMSKYCGMTATIMEIQIGCYMLDIDKGKWVWSDEMFEE